MYQKYPICTRLNVRTNLWHTSVISDSLQLTVAVDEMCLYVQCLFASLDFVVVENEGGTCFKVAQENLKMVTRDGDMLEKIIYSDESWVTVKIS